VRIAVIADVHANLPALRAVMAHAARHQVHALWNLGDVVGFGAFPEEAVRTLREAEALSILGNYDLKVLDFEQQTSNWEGVKDPDRFLAFRWAYEQLSPESRAYLRALSQQARLRVKGQHLLLVHGSPASIEEGLDAETPKARLRELAALVKDDLVLCAHSHRPFVRRAKGVWFINPGSVGRPDDGDPRASYAILKLKRGLFEVRHYRVAYDVERAARAIRQQGLPEIFAQMVLQGRNLDEVTLP